MTEVAGNADGSRRATGAADETARVWDPRARPGVVKLVGHTGSVLTIVVIAGVALVIGQVRKLTR